MFKSSNKGALQKNNLIQFKIPATTPKLKIAFIVSRFFDAVFWALPLGAIIVFSNYFESTRNESDRTFVVIRREHREYFVNFFKKFPKWKGEIIIDRMDEITTPTSSLISFIHQLGNEVSDYLFIHYGDTFCFSDEFLCHVANYPESNCIAVGIGNEYNTDSRRVIVDNGIIRDVWNKSPNPEDSIPRWSGLAYLRKSIVSTFCPTSPLIEEILRWSEKSEEKVRCVTVSVLYNINSPEVYYKLNQGKCDES